MGGQNRAVRAARYGERGSNKTRGSRIGEVESVVAVAVVVVVAAAFVVVAVPVVLGGEPGGYRQ